MKFSENWLREWVNPALSSDELQHQITMAGLEVDGAEPAAGTFTDLVVGEITAMEPHPDADKLKVCTVNDGSDTWSVVCGAPNAAVGLRAPFARIGAELPGGMKIRKAKLRGVESQGMLCSARELGLSDDHSGLMALAENAPVGTALRDYLALNDWIIDVDLTPNRADCLSIRGIAREVGALNDLPVQAPSIEPVPPTIDDRFPVSLQAPQACPKYVGRVIRGIDAQAATPVWMQERLRRSGLRSIDPIVDVTNYVMLELGVPMHGFDLDRLDSGIEVRWARDGEQLALLDEQTITLSRDDLVIADAQEPLALAGIMGGERSGIQPTQTQHVFLECAFFTPLAMAGRARKHGLHTDASHRFERGVDPTLQVQAVERATALLLGIVGGQPGPVVETAENEAMPERVSVAVHGDHVRRVLGAEVPDAEIERIFRTLALSPENHDGAWNCTIPGFRFDLAIAEDLIEEVARVYGYNRLPASVPTLRMTVPVKPESRVSDRDIRRQLVAAGYQEAVTYSFVTPEIQAIVAPGETPLRLANPISEDLSVMRTTLAGGLLRALQYNLNRQQDQVRLFETGLVFRGTAAALEQPKQVAGLLYGDRPDSLWSGPKPVDFYDLKGDVETLLALSAGRNVRFAPREADPLLHPGQAATVLMDGQEAGFLGQLHPRHQSALEIRRPVFLFELSLNVMAQRGLPAYEPLSRYPASQRDLAVVVPLSVPAQALIDSARQAAGEWLSDVRVFDVYTGKGIADNNKSVALQLAWQNPERTLKESEVSAAMDAVVRQLEADHQARLRS